MMDKIERKDRKFPFRRIIIPLIIIVLLLAFLIPAFKKSRESARRAKCLSQLKQIGLALKQYALDNKEIFPWEEDSPLYCASFGKVCPAYMSFTKNPSIFTCPSSSDRRMRKRIESKENEAFSQGECADSLSYAYGHNKGRPLTESDSSTRRIAGDKYALQDYSDEINSPKKPCNHFIIIETEGGKTINIGRQVALIDGSAKWDNNKGMLEADPEWDAKAEMFANKPKYKPLDESNPESDQTGADWWSDPPDKQ